MFNAHPQHPDIELYLYSEAITNQCFRTIELQMRPLDSRLSAEEIADFLEGLIVV